MTTEITPFIWLDADPQAACDYYSEIFDDFEVKNPMRSMSDEVIGYVVTIGGREYSFFNGGPGYPHGNAMSLMVLTDSQEETDHYWAALTADGGEELPCGWLRDRLGVLWQITPRRMMEILAEPETPARKRAFEVMLTMHKLDHAVIEAAYRGER